MAAHHYVPRFVLKRWADKGLISAYSWLAESGKAVANRRTLGQACSVEELNALRTVPATNRYDAEMSFTRIDTAAARALSCMLDGGVSALTPENRRAWARFVNSVPVRMPEPLLHLGPEAFRRAVAEHENDEEGPAWVRPYVSKRFLERAAEHATDAPVQAAVSLSSREEHVDAIADMRWWTRRFDDDRVLIGDRPLLTEPRQPWPCGIPLDHPRAVIALPLSPRVIWYASADGRARTISRRQTGGMALISANRESILRCSVHVFAKTPAPEFRAWVMKQVEERGGPPPLPAYPRS